MGQAPLAATVYELDRLRCNLCGEVFTAPEPEGIGPEKYDETTAAMIALLKPARRRLLVPLPIRKCPHCLQTLSATKATDYIEKNAPGTAKGWRWDQSWSGVYYSIVLNDNIVEDWWDDQALDRLSPRQ